MKPQPRKAMRNGHPSSLAPGRGGFLRERVEGSRRMPEQPGLARDRLRARDQAVLLEVLVHVAEVEDHPVGRVLQLLFLPRVEICLLYTSDAADDLLCVD